MKIHLWLASVAVCLGGLLLPPNGTAGLIGVDLAQVNFNQGADSLSNSNWGSATVAFTGQPSFQYFNLVVNGSWQVHDFPVWSLGGLGSQSQVFNFSLGNTVGQNVSSVQYVTSMTNTPLGTAPAGIPVLASVSDREVTVGGLDGPLGTIPGAVPLIGGVPANWAFNMGMPNQDVGVNECAPGAFSNSLMWLDDRNANITIPANLKSVEGLKGLTNWLPDGALADAWVGKGDALEAYVTTRFIPPGLIAEALAEMKQGEDIEVWGDHHAAVAVGLIQLDGTWAIDVSHDTQQGEIGGTLIEPITFDPATGLLAGGAPGFFAGARLRGFVDESPPVPEPSALVLMGFGLFLLFSGVATRNRNLMPRR